MTKQYSQAPLPFMGQKRFWNNQFKQVIRDNFSDCHTFVDLFGGSGLLSHFTHTVRPDARVVYNDYDGYVERIRHIDETNTILCRLRDVLADYPKGKRIEGSKRSEVVEVLRQAEQTYESVDYISLSNSLLFACRYCTSFDEMKDDTMYNRIRSENFNADGYLEGLTVTHQDYRSLFNQYKGVDGVCFLVDPPYLSTQSKTYTGCWKLHDYLDVLEVLRGTNYVYFTSNKSDLIELCEWIGSSVSPDANPLYGASMVRRHSQLNYAAQYTDIMMYNHSDRWERRIAA